ncbi:MAG: lipid ABC transporter permease/ATP-binding protein, partial [Burkholderiales bacterium]|nr:lipid ABC transporter permease/ATP-binding protein [Burkholderiales bacterium]
MSSLALYKRLLRYVAPYWRTFALSIVALVVVAATEPALPALMKPMLDGTFVQRDPFWIRLIPILIIAIFLVRGIATWAGALASSFVGNKLVMDLREAMFRKIVMLPTGYFDQQTTGNLISKLTFDVAQVMQAATSVVTVVIKDSLIIVGLLAWLLYLNWKLTLLALVMAPLISLIVRLLSERLRAASRGTQTAMGDITEVLEESIEGQKVVKLFGGQGYEQQRFFETSNRARRFAMKQAAAGAANVPIVQMVAAIALAAIVYLATLQSASDETTVGGFVSFIVAMLMLTSPLKRLTSVNEHLQRGLAAAESVFA